MSDRARQRRDKIARNNIRWEQVIYQDLPIEETYIESLRSRGLTIHHKIKWFNAVSISGISDNQQLIELESLPFVKKIEPVAKFILKDDLRKSSPPPQEFLKYPESSISELDYGASLFQNQFHNIPALHEKGLTGEGIIIGVFDTGFNLEHPALQPLKSRVIAEYDFAQGDSITRNQPGDVSNQDFHGTAVLSIMAGFSEGELIGPAYGASFVLAKTEVINYERHVEEDNWAAAAVWAESLGVDIVSSSLGYSLFDAGEGNYSTSDMDGETTIVTRAANMLAARGVLVISSAGNEGNSSWRIITAPADGKNVVAVGAVDTLNQVTGFSSRGPTADGRIKPDVVALGVSVYSAKSNSLSYNYYAGTSVSCPLVSGIAALILQNNPRLSNLDMIDILRQSGDNQQPDGPDNDRGWGKVDALEAFKIATEYNQVPDAVRLLPNRPNPFHDQTDFVIFLPDNSFVRVDIFNILGQRVYNLSFPGTIGRNRFQWDGRNSNGQKLGSGIYFCRITTTFGKKVSKITLIR